MDCLRSRKLNQGFAYVEEADGGVVKSIRQVEKGDELTDICNGWTASVHLLKLCRKRYIKYKDY